MRQTGNSFYHHDDDKLYKSLLKTLQSYLDLGEDYRNRTITLATKQLQNGKQDYEFLSPPGFGVHYIQYKTHWIKLERRQCPEINCEDIPFEFITLSTYKWNRALLYDLLTEAKESQREHDAKKTAFYFISCGDWNPFGQPKRRRFLDSVITAGRLKESLLRDVREFLDSEEWYMERGIPYRRGYLLHGAPGTGKSSLIRAIAGEIGYDICVLSLSCQDLTDDELNRLMNSTPEKSLILLEDVDAAFQTREAVTEGETGIEGGGPLSHVAFGGTGVSKVTFRGLLNALDGVASTEGRIIFVTTNHIDKLDPALTRPGRVDLRVHVDYPTTGQILRMFERFYPKAKEDLGDTFLHILMGMDKKISMAAIQGLFLLFKRDPEEAIQHAEEWLGQGQVAGGKDNFCDTIEDFELGEKVGGGDDKKAGKKEK